MNTPQEIVISSYARTPIGKFGGSLSRFSAPELGGMAIKAAIERAGAKPEDVCEVIMGHVLQAGVGQNPARQAAIKAGCPTSVSAVTVNKVCGSGLKAVMLASQTLACGDMDVVVAGGMESMSRAPYLIPQARDGVRLGHAQLLDAMIQDGLWCPFENWHMGSAAEHIAASSGIGRAEQDAFALESQMRAAKAWSEKKFTPEIVPVAIPQKKGDPVLFNQDEGYRADTTAESLAGLKPAFDRQKGTVTPGNASTINDGGAALLLTRKDLAQKKGWPVKAIVRAQAVGGVDPKMIFHAPVVAVTKLLKKTGLTVKDIDLVEANEAFAVQALENMRELGLDPSKVNIWGGAVALGHPIGASGARVLCTLLNALEQTNGKRGIATLCLGGGNAVALLVERVQS
ncbi:MAG: acetyl-CoA C-acetyltransferase [Planctomycetota bacterium]